MNRIQYLLSEELVCGRWAQMPIFHKLRREYQQWGSVGQGGGGWLWTESPEAVTACTPPRPSGGLVHGLLMVIGKRSEGLFENLIWRCCCSLSCVFFAAGMAFIVLCVQVEITSDRLFGLLELHLSLKVFRPDSFCSAWVNVSVNWIFLCFYVFIPSIPSHPNHITHAPETQGVCLNAVSARVWFWL